MMWNKLKQLKMKTKDQKHPSSSSSSSALPVLDQLNETLEMLEKKEKLLQKKASAEVNKAKDFTKLKNKKAAIQCLKKKKLYESQMETLGNFQLRLHDQIITLEGARATTDTVDALRKGASTIKSIQQSLNIDDIEKAMDEVNEHAEAMKQIQEALATPVGASADIDEDELEAELEELDEELLEEELLSPTQRLPSVPSTSVRIPEKAGRLPSSEIDALAALQAEMAI